MASYHLSVHPNVSRGKGQSLVRTAAYNARTRLEDARTGKVWDYRHYGGLLFEGIYVAKAPAWAQNLGQLVNEIERAEKRGDAQLAMNIDIALPHEHTLEQNRRLLQDFVREQFMRRGYVVHVVIHAPDPDGDQRNIHAHVLVTLRKIGPDGFARTKEEQQERYRNRVAFVEQLREKWENLANRHLARNGIDARIDRRSLKAQGSKREPPQHRGPAVTAMERRGQVTRAGSEIPAQMMAANASIIAARADPVELSAPATIASPHHDQVPAPAPIELYQHSDTAPRIASPIIDDFPEPEIGGVAQPAAHDPGDDAQPDGNFGAAPVSTNRPAPGAVRRLFREAVKAVTRRAENPEPKPRRRSGETGKAFALAAKGMLRRVFELPPEAYAAATSFLSDTLDWLNLWHHGVDDGNDPHDEFDINQNHLSLHL